LKTKKDDSSACVAWLLLTIESSPKNDGGGKQCLMLVQVKLQANLPYIVLGELSHILRHELEWNQTANQFKHTA
jgi:hypothetical protein